MPFPPPTFGAPGGQEILNRNPHWLLLIVALALLGVLTYVIFRPVTVRDLQAAEDYRKQVDFDRASNATEKLHKLSELRDRGDISQEEFEKQKSRLLKG